MTDYQTHRGALLAAGALLGVGLGGFVDGIVFHQILQWHNMLSSLVVPSDLSAMKYNMVWDGLFHAFTWLMTVIGLALLWSTVRRSTVTWSNRSFVGSLLMGWGLFHLVEGIIDHHLIAIHHVHPGANQLAWDIGYLVFGVVLVAIGVGLVAAGRREEVRPGDQRTPPMRGEMASGARA